MLDFTHFYQLLAKSDLYHWLDCLPAQLSAWHRQQPVKLYEQYCQSIDLLPRIEDLHIDLIHAVKVQTPQPISLETQNQIETQLRRLMPWRKGPFDLHGIHLDTEWRSDWKWQRVASHIAPLAGRTVLDVGCGSGYHLWRMVGAGAKLAVGIDPMLLFVCQFEAIRKLLNNDQRAHVLPLGIEQLPRLQAFDTVFSMGVLYHRRSPLDHLLQLKHQLVSGGELVLETLVIDGDENRVLMPSDRYAQMSNVYFLPSALALKGWLAKCGFIDINVVDITITSTDEQRSTSWMTNHSLSHFLDATNCEKTIEGYPAPKRAVLIAKRA